MKLIFVLATLVLTCQGADKIEQSSNPESLEVAKNFRKALLEALEQLENEDNTESNTTTRDADLDDLDESDFDDSKIKFGHKIREKLTKQEGTITSFSNGGKANVFVHSFTTTLPIPKNHKNVDDEETSTARLRTKLVQDNAISASVTSSIAGNNNDITTKLFPNSIRSKNAILPTPTSPVTPKTALTSPTPTVTTPVEEDETKAKVEDVQFIHAPLVAAFTVQQDDKGLPQKVIPIFGNKAGESSTITPPQSTIRNYQQTLEEKQRLLEQQIRYLQEERRQQELLIQQQRQRQVLPQNDINFQQALSVQPLPNTLTQQNNILQQQSLQVQPLQVQRPPQNEPNFFQQQNFQQKHPQIVEQNRFSIPIPTQNDILPFNQQIPTQTEANTLLLGPLGPINNSNKQKSVVAVQPSISFTPNNFNNGLQPTSNNQFNQLQFNNQQSGLNNNLQTTPNNQINQIQFNNQQLPLRSAIDFQKAISVPLAQPITQPIQNFNPLTQQQVPNQFRDNVFNNDNYLQDFLYRQRTLIPPPRGNRVFRQETQVGNPGLNDFSQNRFNQNQQNQFNHQNQHQFSHNQFAQNQFNQNQFFQSQFNQNQFPQRFNPVSFKQNDLRYNQFVQRQNFNNNRLVFNQPFNNPKLQQANVDAHLKNLIFQSGIGQGRTQEDLNIVSKVLALDHTGNIQNNFLFGESKNVERKVPFNNSNKSFKT